jgi:hypothetical protein
MLLTTGSRMARESLGMETAVVLDTEERALK